MAGLPVHPASHKRATWFHGSLAIYFIVGIGLFALGTWFHVTSAKRHWRAHLKGER